VVGERSGAPAGQRDSRGGRGDRPAGRPASAPAAAPLGGAMAAALAKLQTRR